VASRGAAQGKQSHRRVTPNRLLIWILRQKGISGKDSDEPSNGGCRRADVGEAFGTPTSPQHAYSTNSLERYLDRSIVEIAASVVGHFRRQQPHKQFVRGHRCSMFLGRRLALLLNRSDVRPASACVDVR
jgi:hypothetical protein